MSIKLYEAKFESELYNKKLYVNRYNCRQGGGFAIFDENITLLAKAWNFCLEGCEFIVDEDLRFKSLQTKEFTNHAFVTGYLVNVGANYSPKGKEKIVYRLGNVPLFIVSSTNQPIYSAAKVYFINPSVYI